MALSLTGKRWHLQKWNEQTVQELSEALSIGHTVAGILYLRGVRTSEQGRVFLESKLEHLQNPLQVPGIMESADRIVTSMEKRERICVYGDYDVDGVTAASLMVLVLRRYGANVFSFLPHRIKHGYGLHAEIIRQIHSSGAKLLITVDNGIAASDEVALARSLGMDVIITDHHQPPAQLPETPYIVNPKAHEGLSVEQGSSVVDHFSNLAGVGLAFILMVAVRARLRDKDDTQADVLPNLREYLDLVALGTIGDVVPLTGENRILVRHGLREIAQSQNMGIRALLDLSGLTGAVVTPGQVGFILAPRINAAGRIGDPELALRLLVSQDKKEVYEIATALNQENLKRQEIEKKILAQALEQVDREKGEEKVHVLHCESWHPGVIGIVASRIVDRYYRPTIMIAQKNGKGTGSGRSIPQFSLYDALEACRDELEEFGGHTMAAGLTLAWDRIQAFREKINNYAEQFLNEEDLIPTVRVDGLLDPDRISDRLLQGLEKMKPFGIGNPEPTFLSQGVRMMFPRIVGENHLRFQIQRRQGRLNAIGFNMKDHYDSLEESATLDVLYHLRYNEYNGSRTIQAVLVDLRPCQA
jgi:single-stranded-DNA-specific exonuclease